MSKLYACDVDGCPNVAPGVGPGSEFVPPGWSEVFTATRVDDRIAGVFEEMINTFAPVEGVVPLHGDANEHLKHVLRDHIGPYVRPFAEMMQTAFNSIGTDLRVQRIVCADHKLPTFRGAYVEESVFRDLQEEGVPAPGEAESSHLRVVDAGEEADGGSAPAAS